MSSVADSGSGSESVMLAERLEQRELQTQRLSDHLVRGIDFLFALTLRQGILLYKEFWIDPLHPRNLPVFLALVSVYVTTFLSFIDWHLAMERRPYMVARELPVKEWRREWFRVWIDLLIVMVYAFLLVNGTILIHDPNHSINAFLLGYPIIFGLYLGWGLLRRKRYPDSPANRLWLLFFTAIAFLVISLCYRFISGDIRAGNVASLSVVIVITLIYRFISGTMHGGKT
jgi:hypothetical protein